MRLASWLGMGALVGCAACGGAAVPAPAMKPEPARRAQVAEEPAKAEEAPAEVVEVPAEPEPLELVSLQASAERSLLRADDKSDLAIQLRLSADAIPDKGRPRINLALVVDTSGSMQGDAIDDAREACLTLVDQLAVGDQLSVIAFGSQAEVLVPNTVLMDDSTAPIKTKIAAMKASGTTDMAGGLGRGLAELSGKILGQGVNRIVLLGDGVPNDAAAVATIARSAGQQGISITSLGLGVEFDETLMNQIAQHSGGTFHFIEDSSKVAGIFDKEVARLARAVAKNGWLEIMPGPSVELRGAVGLPSMPMGRGLRVQIGELSESQTRDLLLDVRLGPHRAGANAEVLDVTFRYQDAVRESGAQTVHHFVSLGVSSDEKALSEAEDREVQHASVRVRVADHIVRAIATARGGDVFGARKLLAEAEKLARDGAKRFDDEELGGKAAEARKLRQTVASLAPPRVERDGIGSLPHPAAPRPMPHDEALGLRKAHGDAMRVINDL